MQISLEHLLALAAEQSLAAEHRYRRWVRARVQRYNVPTVVYRRGEEVWSGRLMDLSRLDNPRLKVVLRDLLTCPAESLTEPRKWKEGRVPWSVEVTTS